MSEIEDENNKLKELIKRYIIWRMILIIRDYILNNKKDENKLRVFKPFVEKLYDNWLYQEFNKLVKEIYKNIFKQIERSPDWKYYVTYLQYLLILVAQNSDDLSIPDKFYDLENVAITWWETKLKNENYAPYREIVYKVFDISIIEETN